MGGLSPGLAEGREKMFLPRGFPGSRGLAGELGIEPSHSLEKMGQPISPGVLGDTGQERADFTLQWGNIGVMRTRHEPHQRAHPLHRRTSVNPGS